MILLAFIQCESDQYEEICTKVNELCSGVRLCMSLQGLKAPWQNIVLAFFNTVKAVETKKNVARKPELEFYIRFFAERQIHTVLNKYLSRFSDRHKLLLVYSINECTSKVLRNVLENTKCSFVYETHDSYLNQFYVDYLKTKIGEDRIRIFDSIEYGKIVLGIIGCSNLLIKD